ncbi:hypothetical protein Tco_1125189 [Tanacetum coccineum]|uniref:Uncharacterized protein n=1 Tax=Tanacetum coccineum TaxID=301880 RepID=A0ABQ5JCD5_9ASTR
MVSVKNSNAVLQILFFSSQPTDEADLKMQPAEAYETEIPLSSNSSASGDTASVNTALKDLSLSTRARLSLRAALAFEKQ